MLEHFENLRTWKFWVLLIAIFVPLWYLTFVFCKFICVAQSIHLKASLFEIEVEKLAKTAQDLQQKNRMISAAQLQLEGKIDRLLTLTASSPSSLSQTKAELTKLKSDVTVIQAIPEDTFNQIQKDIGSLKNGENKKESKL